MNTSIDTPVAQPSAPSVSQVSPSSSWKRKALILTGIVLGSAGIAAAGTAWWVKRNVYASPLNPVSLTQAEQKTFDEKVVALTAPTDARTPEQRAADEKRTLVLTDKEINAFLNQRGMGEKVKVNLREGSADVTALMPLDQVGGTTLRWSLAVTGNMGADQKPSFRVTDVSVGGVSLPNAWLGDLKGVNLLASEVESDPVVKRFLAGIREFEFKRGQIRVLLNE